MCRYRRAPVEEPTARTAHGWVPPVHVFPRALGALFWLRREEVMDTLRGGTKHPRRPHRRKYPRTRCGNLFIYCRRRGVRSGDRWHLEALCVRCLRRFERNGNGRRFAARWRVQ